MINDREIPALLWLWSPFVILFVILILFYYDASLASFLVGNEKGIIEPATALILFPAMYYGIKSVMHSYKRKQKLLVTWFVIVTLGCLYIAGEELSWGQQIFQWQSPEVFSEINDQNETNIHNMSSWFDQKPRLLLELWILAGCVFVPLINRIKLRRYDQANWQYWFWPTLVSMPAGILAIVVKLPERAANFLDVSGIMYVRYSELQEFYFALFLLMYLYSIMNRLLNSKSTGD